MALETRPDTDTTPAEGMAAADVAGAGYADEAFAVVRPLLGAIASTFGSRCEVVLHDFRRPDTSIVDLAGNVTDRHVGGSVSQIGLAIIAAGDDAEPEYNYVTRAPNGRVLRSTTVPLRDRAGHVYGAFCINVDITEFRMLANVLGEWAGDTEPQAPKDVTFVDDVGEVIDRVIQEEESAAGRPVDRFDKHNRLDILRALEGRGVFSLQRSVPRVAEYLGVSRATVYTYLRELRGDGDDPEASAA